MNKVLIFQCSCDYKYLVPKGEKVIFDFVDFELEDGDNQGCTDGIQFFLDKTQSDKICGRQSDKMFEFGPLDHDWEMKATFKSTSKKGTKGFYISIHLAIGQFLDLLPLPGTNPEVTTVQSPCSCQCEEQTTPKPESFNCGSLKSTKIVGGNETNPFSIPWQVGLVTTGFRRPWCGGTLISPIHVLTAAHCTAGETANSIQVIVGEHDLESDEDGVAHNVSCIADHPNYDSQTVDYDFSVLTLSSPVDLLSPTSNARAACLPSNVSDTYAGVELTVSGWGALSSGGGFPTVLHEAQVSGVTNQECMESYGTSITDRMLCAGRIEGGIDSCQGDSGGPLTVSENGKHTVVGVVSWGYRCAFPGFYGVYARVTSVLQWIKAQGIQTVSNKCM